jgi:CheY-like chemotaxis protein
MAWPTEIAATGKRILVIDDQPLIRDLLRQFLQADGHCVFTAVDGTEGLAKARALRPDLILLDVDMPAPNGLQVCAQLKHEPATAQVPVLFISARLSTHDIGQMAAVGAAGFLPKPFLLVDVRQAINRLLGLTASAQR